MTTWYKIYITDKTGEKFFETSCAEWGLYSEKKNLNQHLDNAKKYPKHYKFLDIETAHLVAPNLHEFEFTADDEALLESLGV